MELYILDRDYNVVGVLNNYQSLVWAKRYIENGDCELVIPLGETKNVQSVENYELAPITKSEYIDVSNFDELNVSNNTIGNESQLLIFPYIGVEEQESIGISAYMENGAPIDISKYDGIKFLITASMGAGNKSFNYKLRSKGLLNIIKSGHFIVRSDDDMVCRIKDITIETGGDNGDKISVKAYDMKSLIDQRYMFQDFSVTDSRFASIADVVFLSVVNNIGYDSSGDVVPIKRGEERLRIEKDEWNVNTDILDIQNEWSNLGEFVRKYCTDKNVGIKVTLGRYFGENNDWCLNLSLYEGTDKTNAVRFSDDMGNIASSKYSIENSTYYNTFVVNTNDSEGKIHFVFPDDVGQFSTDSKLDTVNETALIGIDRFEGSVDAEIAYHPDYETLRDTLYPGGTLTTNAAGTTGEYKVANLKVECPTVAFHGWISNLYPGTSSQEGGKSYYTISGDAIVARLARMNNTDSWQVSMTTIAMYPTLYNAGLNALAENLPKETFEGTVIPNGIYKYKTDYDLGDIVKIENKYGVSADARITEVIETIDENGSSISLTFENKNIKMR